MFFFCFTPIHNFSLGNEEMFNVLTLENLTLSLQLYIYIYIYIYLFIVESISNIFIFKCDKR